MSDHPIRYEWQLAIQSGDAASVGRILKDDPRFIGQCVQLFREDGTWFLLDPLCEAARHNHVNVATELIEAGKNPNHVSGLAEYYGPRDGAYCLAWAASDEMKQFLTDHGADSASIEGKEIPHLKDRWLETGWGDSENQTKDNLGEQWQEAHEAEDVDRVRSLLEKHPHLLQQSMLERDNGWPMNTLYRAAHGNLAMTQLLAESGLNDPYWLKESIRIGGPEVVPYLMQFCDDIDPDIGLHAYCANWEALKFWFERGYKPHTGMLHDACCGRGRFRGFHRDDHADRWPERFRETVRVLIAAGADVNERNAGGNHRYEGSQPWVTNQEVPLHFAAGAWDVEVIQQLLNAGADKTLKNDLGDTPYDWAVRYEAPEETKALLRTILGNRTSDG